MIVLDCNAAVEMALGTPKGNGLTMLAAEGEKVIAPRMFCAELAHALCKYVRAGVLSADKAQDTGAYAFQLIDEFHEDGDIWAEALSESLKFGHSPYDLFYFVMARRNNATLFTFDKKLATLCDQEGVKCVQEVEI